MARPCLVDLASADVGQMGDRTHPRGGVVLGRRSGDSAGPAAAGRHPGTGRDSHRGAAPDLGRIHRRPGRVPWFYETNGGVFNLYKQPYWYAVVALVALAISVCTVSRAPPIWRTVRRPPKRVNAAYFDRARHRASAAIDEDEQSGSARDQLVARLRASRYRVEEVSASDNEVMLFADRYGWAQLATFVTHLALLLLLGATLVTKFAGEEYQFWVAEGESHILFPPGDDRAQVQIIVDDAVARFADDGQALDFRSFVRVAEGGFEVGGGEVTVNGPVHAAGYRVHQAAYWEHGAELRVFDHSSGQLLYAETHFLDQQIVGPRIRVERGGAVVSEEVISLQHQVADEVIDDGAEDVRISGYSLIPLDAARSLTVTMVPSAEGYEFWYRVIPTPAAASGLTFAELGVGQDPPLGPRLKLATGDRTLFEGVVSLDQAEGEAMLAALPLTEDEFLLVGCATRMPEKDSSTTPSSERRIAVCWQSAKRSS